MFKVKPQKVIFFLIMNLTSFIILEGNDFPLSVPLFHVSVVLLNEIFNY